ncbi:MAG TPA: SDR family oxidoreductase [Acidimicrobiales bacterium]|nr:SDR family oxidoreductase [Acidimicrobiales bacterium]
MDLGLEGRAALVTGASKGLGLASAIALAQDGARVAIVARTASTLADAHAAVTAASTGRTDVLAIAADVTAHGEAERVVTEAVEAFGGVDILVPNAGGPPPGGAWEVTDDALRAAFEANCLASIRLARAALPSMQARRWGRICCITSAWVKQPSPYLSLSNVARTGLWAWVKTAAADVAADGVTVNLVCPGLHDTDRIRALGGSGGARMGDPADFGKVVAFLCSEPAAFVSGAALQVDGGATLGLL